MPANDLLSAARAIKDQLVGDRRAIHQYPELAYQEERTAALVAARLRELGIGHRTGIAETGVVGLIQGAAPGKTVLLRADMDALPIHELSEAPYASKVPGVMHACGHDGHTAMLLGAARLLQQARDSFCGNVKLMFQPAEEGGAGAQRMIEAGLLDDPAVDAAFALHVTALVESGLIAVKDGPIYASSDHFEISVNGSGGHAAQPHRTVDPIAIAAQIVVALQTLVSREIDPIESAVVTVGSLQAGTTFNVIPDEAKIKGTVRTYTLETQELLERRIEELARGIAAGMRAEAKVEYVRLYPPVINHLEGADLVARAVEEMVGAEALTPDKAAMGGEDFAFVLQKVPGAMFRLGVRKPEWREPRLNHNAAFDLDEAALPLGAAALAATALRFLQS